MASLANTGTGTGIATDGLTSASVAADFSAATGDNFLIVALHENCTDPDNCTGVIWDATGEPLARLCNTGVGPSGDQMILYGLVVGDYAGSGNAVASFASASHNGWMQSSVGTSVNQQQPLGADFAKFATYVATASTSVPWEPNDLLLNFASYHITGSNPAAMAGGNHSYGAVSPNGQRADLQVETAAGTIPATLNRTWTWGSFTTAGAIAALGVALKDTYNNTPGYIERPDEISERMIGQ